MKAARAGKGLPKGNGRNEEEATPETRNTAETAAVRFDAGSKGKLTEKSSRRDPPPSEGNPKRNEEKSAQEERI